MVEKIHLTFLHWPLYTKLSAKLFAKYNEV
jgi:hypothetical protein